MSRASFVVPPENVRLVHELGHILECTMLPTCTISDPCRPWGAVYNEDGLKIIDIHRRAPP